MELVECDGCGADLVPAGSGYGERVDGLGRRRVVKELVIAGERVNRSGGGGIPNGKFHLCIGCAQLAFTAIREVSGGS